MKGRALRRHHRQRMVEKARALFTWWGEDEERIRRNAPRFANNLAWCSCYSCGNPRRHFGFTVYGHTNSILTRQEVLSDVDFEEWREELVSETHSHLRGRFCQTACRNTVLEPAPS